MRWNNGLTVGLRERQIAEFVEHDEIDPHEQIGDLARAAAAPLDVEPVDEIDDGVEPAARAMANATAGDRHRQVLVPPINTRLRCWMRKAPVQRSRTSPSFDRRIGKPEVGELRGQRQLGDTELVGDRAGVLFGVFALQQLTRMWSAECCRFSIILSKAARMPAS